MVAEAFRFTLRGYYGRRGSVRKNTELDPEPIHSNPYTGVRPCGLQEIGTFRWAHNPKWKRSPDRFRMVVNILFTLRGYHGKNGNLRKLRNCQPNPNPPYRRMRSIQQIFAHAVSCGSQCAFSHTGENFESTALGVECVLRKVRRERQRATTNSVEAVSHRFKKGSNHHRRTAGAIP